MTAVGIYLVVAKNRTVEIWSWPSKKVLECRGKKWQTTEEKVENRTRNN